MRSRQNRTILQVLLSRRGADTPLVGMGASELFNLSLIPVVIGN